MSARSSTTTPRSEPTSSLRLQFLNDVCRCILFHHERPDGNGDPSAISGAAIPLGARIISIADSIQRKGRGSSEPQGTVGRVGTPGARRQRGHAVRRRARRRSSSRFSTRSLSETGRALRIRAPVQLTLRAGRSTRAIIRQFPLEREH